MPGIEGDTLYKSRELIRTGLINSLRTMVPDAWMEEDGNIFMLFDIIAGQMEGLYVANQIVLEDMFIQTANIPALDLHGAQMGVPRKIGTKAAGNLRFAGIGGTYIPIGAEAAYDVGFAEEPLFYLTTLDGTLPNPGFPSAPVTAAGAAGSLTGTYEYVISFLTAAGETIPGASSTPLAVTSKQINLSAIPLGGPGTTGRRIYRQLNGGGYLLVTTINDNTTTVFVDNVGAPAGAPLDEDTAQAITLTAEAEEPGAAYNAVPGAIAELTNVPDGITAVTNPASFTGGTDPEETEDYRTRLLNLIRAPGTGSPLDIEVWAESVSGVDEATVFSNMNGTTPTNGHVTVRISGPNGTIPSGSVVTAVLDYLNSKDLANVTFHVLTFTQISTNVTVDVDLEAGYILGDVTSSVTQAITDYINSVPVGGTVYPAGIVDAIFGLSGITNVSVSVPATPQTSSATEKRIAGTITVT